MYTILLSSDPCAVAAHGDFEVRWSLQHLQVERSNQTEPHSCLGLELSATSVNAEIRED